MLLWSPHFLFHSRAIWFALLRQNCRVIRWVCVNRTFIYIICKNNSEWKESNDDVMKWKHFPRNWPFVRGIHRSPVNSQHKSQWRGALMFSLIYVWINGWVNNREAGDLRRHHAHYDVIVMMKEIIKDDGDHHLFVGSYFLGHIGTFFILYSNCQR